MPTVQNDKVAYTPDEVKDIISAQVLAIRLENIERKNADNWSQFREHIASEDRVISEIYNKISEINARIGSNNNDLNHCKGELEEKIKREYVTRENLEVSLLKNSEAIGKLISDRFDTFTKHMEELSHKRNSEVDKLKIEIQSNRELLRKYLYIGTGLGFAVLFVIGVVDFFSKIVTVLPK